MGHIEAYFESAIDFCHMQMDIAYIDKCSTKGMLSNF